MTVGRIGFLSILETQLGLVSSVDPPSVRLMQYRECLNRLDNDRRFYHKSFQVDEIGVTKTLLEVTVSWIHFPVAGMMISLSDYLKTEIILPCGLLFTGALMKSAVAASN